MQARRPPAGAPPPYDHQAGLAALLHVLRTLTHPDLFRVGVTLYLADKLHLSRYGRQLSGETYCADPDGPRPQHLELLLSSTDRPGLLAQLGPDMDALSESDTDCLDAAATRVQPLSFAQARDLSRDAAWRAARERGLRTGERTPPLLLDDIVGTLENAGVVRAHLHDPHP